MPLDPDSVDKHFRDRRKRLNVMESKVDVDSENVYHLLKGALVKLLTRDALSRPRKQINVKVSDALALLTDIEADKLLDNAAVVKAALRNVEQDGIIFIEEIDKLCISFMDKRGEYGMRLSSDDRYAELLQRDLLPLLEGCVVETRYGPVKTDHILFIASGAFHNSQPSMLLPELQGRLPIRVQLKPLSENDLYSILTRDDSNNLIQQQVELLKTEGVVLQFDEKAIREIAKIAFEVNNALENIGARRLNTIIERVVEDISFCASNMSPENYTLFADILNSDQPFRNTGSSSEAKFAPPPINTAGYEPPPSEGRENVAKIENPTVQNPVEEQTQTEMDAVELMKHSLGVKSLDGKHSNVFGSVLDGASSSRSRNGLELTLKCIGDSGALVDVIETDHAKGDIFVHVLVKT